MPSSFYLRELVAVRAQLAQAGELAHGVQRGQPVAAHVQHLQQWQFRHLRPRGERERGLGLGLRLRLGGFR